jgi:Mce-associated membrane protein
MSRRSVPRVLRLAAHNAEPSTVPPGPRAALALVPPPAGRPSPPSRPPSTPRPSRPPRARGRWLVAGLVLVLGAAGGASAWAGERANAADQAGRDGLGAAVGAAQALLSYDHRRVDADLAAAARHTTGQFRAEYTETSKTVAPMAKRYQAVVTASVKAASIVRATPDEVVALLFVDQSTRSTRVTGTKIDQARVRLTMRHTDGSWRVAKVEAL